MQKKDILPHLLHCSVSVVAVLPRNMLLSLIQCCDLRTTWGYMCARGRTGHAVGVALVLSDAPFNLKLAITVTRADPVCLVLCLGPCIGLLFPALAASSVPVDVTHYGQRR